MVEVRPIPIGDKAAIGIHVRLPKTDLIAITTGRGYVMCGALDVNLFNTEPRLAQREVIAGRAFGVRTLEDLLEARLAEVTLAAASTGVTAGTPVRDALARWF